MKLAQTLSGILGLVLAIIAIRWMISPEESAESLNMILLEGEGRNTQIRDFTGIFLSTSVFCFISMITRQYQWVCCAGLVFLIIALMSILASQIHLAPITYSSLIAEVIFAVMALVSSFLFKFK
jgi:hypothetical protein